MDERFTIVKIGEQFAILALDVGNRTIMGHPLSMLTFPTVAAAEAEIERFRARQRRTRF